MPQRKTVLINRVQGADAFLVACPVCGADIGQYIGLLSTDSLLCGHCGSVMVVPKAARVSDSALARVCPACRQTLPRDAFDVKPRGGSVFYGTYCRDCRRKVNREAYRETRSLAAQEVAARERNRQAKNLTR